MKSLKKLLPAFIATSFIFSAHAELHKPHRYFEISQDVTFSASNNYVALADVLKKDVVFDLSTITKKIPKSGFNINFNFNEMTDLRLNFDEIFRIDFFAGSEGYVDFTLDKKFFEFISGFDGRKTYNIGAHAGAEAYAIAGIKMQTFSIIEDFGFTLKPSIFVPVFYCPKIEAKATYKEENNRVNVSMDGKAKLYTLVPGDTLFEDHEVTEPESIMNSAGFTLELGVEKNIFHGLDVGVYTQLPIIPGRLDYCTEMGFTGKGYINNILGKKADGEDLTDWDYDRKDNIYTKDSIRLHRPFKLGAEAAWRPFGSWLTFRPELTFVVRSPFSQYANAGLEYSLGAEFSAWNFLGLNLCTNYRNNVFSQQMGLMINLRVLEIDFAVATSSSDFLYSFTSTGATVYAGVKIGF